MKNSTFCLGLWDFPYPGSVGDPSVLSQADCDYDDNELLRS